MIIYYYWNIYLYMVTSCNSINFISIIFFKKYKLLRIYIQKDQMEDA